VAGPVAGHLDLLRSPSWPAGPVWGTVNRTCTRGAPARVASFIRSGRKPRCVPLCTASLRWGKSGHRRRGI